MRGFPQIEGGVEKHCEALYPRMSKDARLFIFRRKPYVCSKQEYDGITFIDLPSTKIKGFEAVLHSFIATIKTLFMKPDLVHYHNIGPALFSPILKLCKIPVVLTYHSPNYEHDKWSGIIKKLLLFCERTALKTADKIIFVNSFQLEKYSDDVKAKSIYLPNGIDKLEKSPNTDYLEKLGLEKGKYILSVGRITPEKGFDTLIKAFKKSNAENYKLVIAGGVEFEDSYMSSLKELSGAEEVIFTGYVYGDNLAQLYTNAALYVLASRNEGFPLVLLEAMRYELDILVSDIPATHLVSLNDNDYFKCNDIDMLADKITDRLKAPTSRKYCLDEFDWQKIANEVEAIYKSIYYKE